MRQHVAIGIALTDDGIDEDFLPLASLDHLLQIALDRIEFGLEIDHFLIRRFLGRVRYRERDR